jgi:hypothetical protein
MRYILGLIGRMVAGIGACGLTTPVPFSKYPFTFPEKALTADWMASGEDINRKMEKRA